MKRFTQLYCELDETTRTNQKVAALEKYFHEIPPADAAWALLFLCGRTLPRAISTRHLWQWMADESGLPMWLLEECYDSVGDLAETMALLGRDSGAGTSLSLSALVEQRLVPLRQLPESARRTSLMQTWHELNFNERLVWNKLITGQFRIGVGRTLVIRALASVAHIAPAIMAHRIMGKWQPSVEDFQRLMSGEVDANEIARPYPFFLASPLELLVKKGEGLDLLGPIADWSAEWKWDGIRAQLIRRGGETLLWSRGDEMLTATFPEIVEAGNLLPEGTVLDGEILAWQDDRPLPFARLQRRLGRKQVAPKARLDFPIAFVAYDLLELDGKDLRAEPLRVRRPQLERLLADVSARAEQWAVPASDTLSETPLLPGFQNASTPDGPAPFSTAFPLRISPLVCAEAWEELAKGQREARHRGVEGLMLKKRSSAYGVGRQRGDWWKWKIDPFVIDAVLISAQPGHGRRASLYTDYTFGLWEQGQLVPVAKAYSGLTDEEIHEVDAFVRRHTVGKFGPVRSVTPQLVFELAFEGIQKSTRHKAGVAVRFPRMNRWRRDKKPEEADTLDTLRALAQGPGSG